MKINGNAIKEGNVIEHNNGLWLAVKVGHVKPGKGGAFAQIELKNLRDGSKLNERFRSSESIERVILDEKKTNYLYEDENNYIFMDAITYEQKYISKDIIGEKGLFLKDGMEVILNLFEDETISVQLPDTVIMEVVEADAVVKGQTASSSYKPGIIENGLRVMVPPHIEVGTKIVIKPEDLTYVEKAKG